MHQGLAHLAGGPPHGAVDRGVQVVLHVAHHQRGPTGHGDQDMALQVGTVPDAPLLGDRIQLDIVLRSLLANALQALASASPPPGAARRVTVDAGVDGARVWIRVADNGPGIAGKIRDRLFEPFVSLKSSGLGLGLAISRSIVEAHGGALTAEPGPQAVFTMTLPAQPARAHRRERHAH